MVDFGDLVCFQSRDVNGTPEMAFAEGEAAWLCPSLHGDNSGTKISNFIKALIKGPDGAVKYRDVAVSSLPADPSAAGIRHGAADLLACSVPAELAVFNTGHDLTGLSALWEYLRARLALCMPGAIALAGFPPLPYGHLGMGPASPTLSALDVLENSPKSVELENMIDSLFNLTARSTLPSLCSHPISLFPTLSPAAGG